MALNDQQHENLKSLIKKAHQSKDYNERIFAIEDAAKILGISSDGEWRGAEFMKHKIKPRLSDEILNDVVKEAGLEADKAQKATSYRRRERAS